MTIAGTNLVMIFKILKLEPMAIYEQGWTFWQIWNDCKIFKWHIPDLFKVYSHSFQTISMTNNYNSTGFELVSSE